MTREKVLLDTGPLVAFLKIHLTAMLAPTNRVFRCASTHNPYPSRPFGPLLKPRMLFMGRSFAQIGEAVCFEKTISMGSPISGACQ